MLKNYFFTACAASLCLFANEEIDILTIDFSEYKNPETRPEIIKQVKQAMHEVGFFAVKNTGIDTDLINKTFDVAKEFFALDEDLKRTIDGTHTGYQRGLVPYGKESSKGFSLGDHKEYLHIGREFTQEQRDRLKVWENLWPEFYDLKGGMLPYMIYLETYMVEMQRLLALCLGVEETFFDEKTADGDCLLRVLHYLAPNVSDDERRVWATPHTDIDLFTILPQATASGLEVQLADGRWVQMNAEEGSFIINTGDFMEVFSNGYFKSAKHRVMSPSANESGERYSMVYFVHISADDVMSPIPQWIIETGGFQKFATATRHEMLFERLCDLGQSTPWMMEYIRDHKLIERLMQFDRASEDAMIRLREYGYASDTVLEKLEELGL